MPKILKIIGTVILALVVLIIIIIKISGSIPTPGDKYWQNLETGGEIEKKYLQKGLFDVGFCEEPSLQGFEKYEIWYPSELETVDKKYPVIVINNGTGWKASRSRYIYERYASWGFIVIGNEDGYTWNGFSSEMMLRHLEKLNSNKIVADKDNVFYKKIDFDNIGVLGHSQGGVGVFNSLTTIEHREMIKTAVALSPTNKELAKNLEWYYDATKIKVPIMLISGEGGGDDWVVTGERLEEIYNDIPGSKIMLRRKNTPHGETQFSEDGYVMAWFMWQLQGDTEATKAFSGDGAEILSNNLYQDQKMDL